VQQLAATEVPLKKVFSSEYDFKIPTYQRPYAWEKEQALQLLDDLEEALERPGDDPYFLGSIVLVKNQESPGSDVIDGQQRLTTLTILLAVLRDRTSDDEFSKNLGEMIREPGNLLQALAPKPRLTLRDRDVSFFTSKVQQPSAIAGLTSTHPSTLDNDAQRSVRANAEALDERVSGWSEKEVLRFAQFLANRTILVVVTTPDLSSAYRIFSVMNARGLDLSPADIFKSQVIGAIGEESTAAADEAAKRWEDAEGELGRTDFADLFLHIRMIFARRRARKDLLREFPEQVLNAYLPANAKAFVDEVVVPYAQHHLTIRDKSFTAPHGAERINNWFKRLEQIDNNDWRPPAMWAMENHGDDVAWLDDFLHGLERLTASMFIRRVYTTPRVDRFAELLKQLHDGKGLDAPSLQLTELERTETRQRLGGDLYLSLRVRKAVLLRLDEVLAKTPGVTYDHGIITVEHVLPQTPKPDSKWNRDYTPEERGVWTHRLANLVLLNQRKNSEAQNFEFEAKKMKYFGGKNGVAVFALTTQVLQQEQWTPSYLKVRQEELIGVLAKEWSI
jgi:Protein of unknown function DUF262/Protein of unknown function (DUF1524)